MSKFPMSWHRDTIANHAAHLEYIERQIAREQAAVERVRADLVFYRAQMAEAEKRGLMEFDAGALLVKHRRAAS
jgi:hypothetical protein